MAGQGKPGAAAAASLDNHTRQQRTQLELGRGGRTIRGLPPKTHISTAFQNSVTCWGANVQTQKPAEEILHAIHSI